MEQDADTIPLGYNWTLSYYKDTQLIIPSCLTVPGNMLYTTVHPSMDRNYAGHLEQMETSQVSDMESMEMDDEVGQRF